MDVVDERTRRSSRRSWFIGHDANRMLGSSGESNAYRTPPLGLANARFSRRGATTGHERRGTPVAATNEVSAGATATGVTPLVHAGRGGLAAEPADGAASAASASYSATRWPW
jgi:hypothetical protein